MPPFVLRPRGPAPSSAPQEATAAAGRPVVRRLSHVGGPAGVLAAAAAPLEARCLAYTFRFNRVEDT